MALKWFHKKVNLHWIIWMVSVCVGVQNIKNSAFSMQIISIYLKTYFIILHAVCIYWEGEAINLNSGKNISILRYMVLANRVFVRTLFYTVHISLNEVTLNGQMMYCCQARYNTETELSITLKEAYVYYVYVYIQ